MSYPKPTTRTTSLASSSLFQRLQRRHRARGWPRGLFSYSPFWMQLRLVWTSNELWWRSVSLWSSGEDEVMVWQRFIVLRCSVLDDGGHRKMRLIDARGLEER